MKTAINKDNYISELEQAKPGAYFGEAHYKAMLRNMAPGCDVGASSTKQGGTIVRIFRNIYGVPVCVQVATGEEHKQMDYISVDRIDFFEPTRECSRYYDDLSAWMFS